MKRISILFLVFAFILSNVMCAVIAYNYCDMKWGIEYAGYSAPANTAFLLGIPYLIGIIICIILAIFLNREKS